MRAKKLHFIQKTLLSFTIVFLFFIESASAYSFRQYTGKDGLSNLVVTSVYQDHNGLMWFGTNDGLKSYDGLTFQNFHTTEEQSFLTGHAVGEIFETEDNVFWVLTDNGLNRIDQTKQTLRTFDSFTINAKIVTSPSRDIYAFKDNNCIYYYRSAEDDFEKITINELPFDGIVGTFIDRDHNLWIFMDNGNHRCFSITRESGEVKLSPQTAFKHQESILWCFYEEENIYFVDATLTLYAYNLYDKTKYYIQDIQAVIARNGDVSSIIKHTGDFYIGFTNGGLVRIKNMPSHRNQYQIDDLSFRAGVLSLYKDKFQDILWIGTNGQGVYMLFNEPSSLAAVLSGSLSASLQSPITAIYRDDRRSLWIGSAGNGVVSIPDYNPERGVGSRAETFSPANSLLGGAGVNTFAPSAKNLLWMGTENGINYYSYLERRIKNMTLVADGKPVKQVQAICEVNDTTLWVATAGEGLIKIQLVGTPDSPIAASAKRIYAGDGSAAANMFTVAYRENNNTIWFGTKGNGVYKVESASEKMEHVLFAKGENQLQNRINSILKNSEGYWFATGDGLARMAGTEKVVFDDNNGFTHKAVHGILEDNSGNLWLSTSRGIVKFNMEKLTSHLCKQVEDKTITGFGDGACFKDPLTNMLLFGGENGFVSINENDFVQPDYTPLINFTGLSVFGKTHSIYQYMTTKRGKSTIRLNYDQNVFGVSFVANDYIDGKDYTYFYKLNEQGDSWVDNSSSNTASFTYMAPGKYTLSAKYRNNVTGKESHVSQVTIRILPRWYQTWWAYLIYFAVVVGALYITRVVFIWYNRRMTAKLVTAMKQKYHEMGANTRLEFFTSMSNEFHSPLALIQNSSEKILADPAIDENIRKHINLIRNNTNHLESFICDLNELRMLEAGDRKQQASYLPVSELADALAALFIERAEAGKIKYQIKIKNGLYWVSDSYYLCRLVGNLLSYAFVNVKEQGVVTIELMIREGNMQIVTSYTGELPVSEMTSISRSFNYTKAIDILEEDGRADASTFDSRLLAMNYGIVRELKGEMDAVQQEELAVFTVTLPEYMPEVPLEEIEEGSEVLPTLRIPEKYILCEPPKVKQSANKNTILLVDDNATMHCLATDLLHDTYNVVAITDAERVVDLLHTGKYDLLISKTNMPVINGIELTKLIKADVSISHIPCILLASANRGEERDAALSAGADLYVPKPLDPDDLLKELAVLLQYKKVQAYLNSREHKAFELGDEYFATDDEKSFYEKIIVFIENNVKDTELSVEMISESLGCTTQELYTRLKGITKKTPNEIIRAYRLSVVERLLVSTNLSVEDIISRVGFGSRSSFFKLFMQEHGMTPKNYREQQKKMLLKSIW